MNNTLNNRTLFQLQLEEQKDINELMLIDDWLYMLCFTFNNPRLRQETEATDQRFKVIREELMEACKKTKTSFGKLNLIIKDEYQKDDMHVHGLMAKKGFKDDQQINQFAAELESTWGGYLKAGGQRRGRIEIARIDPARMRTAVGYNMKRVKGNRYVMPVHCATKRLVKRLKKLNPACNRFKPWRLS